MAALARSEQRRLREVRKYYTRSNDIIANGDGENEARYALSAVPAIPLSNPDKIPTALMQLVACRLGMQRAMVSVVDEDAQVTTIHKREVVSVTDTT